MLCNQRHELQVINPSGSLCNAPLLRCHKGVSISVMHGISKARFWDRAKGLAVDKVLAHTAACGTWRHSSCISVVYDSVL